MKLKLFYFILSSYNNLDWISWLLVKTRFTFLAQQMVKMTATCRFYNFFMRPKCWKPNCQIIQAVICNLNPTKTWKLIKVLFLLLDLVKGSCQNLGSTSNSHSVSISKHIISFFNGVINLLLIWILLQSSSLLFGKFCIFTTLSPHVIFHLLFGVLQSPQGSVEKSMSYPI